MLGIQGGMFQVDMFTGGGGEYMGAFQVVSYAEYAWDVARRWLSNDAALAASMGSDTVALVELIDAKSLCEGSR
jgi:hypothetical protein